MMLASAPVRSLPNERQLQVIGKRGFSLHSASVTRETLPHLLHQSVAADRRLSRFKWPCQNCCVPTTRMARARRCSIGAPNCGPAEHRHTGHCDVGAVWIKLNGRFPAGNLGFSLPQVGQQLPFAARTIPLSERPFRRTLPSPIECKAAGRQAPTATVAMSWMSH
jgi:hypothetical protein